MLHHAFPAEASTATPVFQGPARVIGLRVANQTASAVNVKVYVSPQRDPDVVQESHALFPSTNLSATLTDDERFDVPGGWTVYAWCDTAHAASFWITTE
jgi:hypothetical protein